MSSKGILTGGRALTKWIQQNSTQGSLLQKIINGVNTLASNTASSAVGRLPPPPPIQGLNVTVGGEYAHITINHNAPIQQGIHYFVESGEQSQLHRGTPDQLWDFADTRSHPPCSTRLYGCGSVMVCAGICSIPWL
jgi:hypothetical protein